MRTRNDQNKRQPADLWIQSALVNPLGASVLSIDTALAPPQWEKSVSVDLDVNQILEQGSQLLQPLPLLPLASSQPNILDLVVDPDSEEIESMCPLNCMFLISTIAF